MSAPLYIFDLDGTLANCDHRKHLVGAKDDPNRWEAFTNACVMDPPYSHICTLLNHLIAAEADIWIFTSRNETVRDLTEYWLETHTYLRFKFAANITHDQMLMRPEGDHTPSAKLKGQWVDAISPVDRERIVCVFEDDPRLVRMWREKGIACFHVGGAEDWFAPNAFPAAGDP
jgi:hypothetical protein